MGYPQAGFPFRLPSSQPWTGPARDRDEDWWVVQAKLKFDLSKELIYKEARNEFPFVTHGYQRKKGIV